MNNLPNSKRKSRNIHSFLAFLLFVCLSLMPDQVWGIERSGFFNGREKWAKGFENQRV